MRSAALDLPLSLLWAVAMAAKVTRPVHLVATVVQAAGLFIIPVMGGEYIPDPLTSAILVKVMMVVPTLLAVIRQEVVVGPVQQAAPPQVGPMEQQAA